LLGKPVTAFNRCVAAVERINRKKDG